MAQSAGTVYAEIRVALDKLQGDISKVTNQFRMVETAAEQTSTKTSNQFTVMGKQVGKGIEQLSNSTIGQFSKMMGGLQKALMAAPIIGAVMMIIGAVKKLFSGVANWINETSQAYIKNQQEIAKLNSVLQSTGSVAWTSTRQMKDLAQEISNSTGKSVNEIMQMQSVLLGFRTITGETFDRTAKAIVDMAAVMGGDLTSAANTFGKAIDSPVVGMTALSRQGFLFDEETKDLVKNLEAQGKHLEAQDVILKEVEKTFGGTAQAINDVNSAQSRLETETERLKVAQGEATTGISVWWKNIRADWKESRADAQELRNAIAKAEKADYSQQIKQIESLTENLKKASTEEEKIAAKELLTKVTLEFDREQLTDQMVLAQRDLDNYTAMMANYGQVVNAVNDEEYARRSKILEQLREEINLKDKEIAGANEIAAARAAELALLEADNALIEEQNNKIIEAEEKRLQIIGEAQEKQEKGLITLQELASVTKKAYEDEANTILTVRNALQGLTMQTEKGQERQNQLTDDYNRKLNDSIAAWKSINIVSGSTGKSGIVDRREQYQAEFRRIVAIENELARAEIQSQETADANIFAAKQRLYSQLKALAVEYGAKENLNPETYRQMTAAAEEVKKELTAMANVKLNENIEKMNEELVLLKGNAKQVAEIEKKRYLDAIKNTDEYKNADEKTQEAVIKKAEEVYNAMNAKNPWKGLLEGVNQYGGQVAGIINAGVALWASSEKRITDELLAELEKRYEIEKEAMDQRYESLLEDLDRRREAELYEAGLLEAYDVESAEESLERAKQSLNEKAVLTATNILKRKQIEAKFAAEQKTLEEQRAKEQKDLEEQKNKERAELEYRAAMATYQQSIIQALMNAALAVSSALAMPWPVGLAMAGLATGLGAMQVALVRANKPQMQSFANGGIVAGNSFSGDNNLVRANAGERLVTQRQQERMSDWLDGEEGGGGKISVAIPIYLDGKLIAESVVDNINDGNYLIRQERGII